MPGAYAHTHKAVSATRQRQWQHVVDSEAARGKSRPEQIKIANGVVKKNEGGGTHSAHVGQEHG